MVSAWMIAALASQAHASTPVASTEWRDAAGERHGALLAFDGLLETAWVADVADASPWLELRLDSTTAVESVSVWPGDLTQGASSYRTVSRPTQVTVQLVTDAAESEWPTATARLRGDLAAPQRFDVPVVGTTRKVRIKFDAVQAGDAGPQLYVAEAAVNFASGERPAAVTSVGEWAASTAATKAAEQLDAEVVSFFAALSAEPSPPADAGAEPAADTAPPVDKAQALASLISWAGDGAPHLRARVAKVVPAGFRMSALPSEPKAIDALVKLRDPAAIAGLERASLRATGRDQQRLDQQIAYYYAFAELIAGQAPADKWGSPGWGPGALQSFGEVPNLDADSFGHVFIADLGNHRVQRFTASGAADRSWGAPSTADDHVDQITNVSLSGKRKYYVAGAPPSTADSGFTFPLDVAVLPGKEADGFAVLDSTKRVQTFNGAGELVRSWPVLVEDELVTGVGGQAFLVNAKGKLVVVWGSEVVSYGQDAEELSRFTLKRGAPSGAVGLKSGKVGLVYEQELVVYSLDGFEHGNMLGDELPQGFESWDVAQDAAGALWILTDTGWLLKYKKPGKLEFKVRAVEDPLGYLRIAAVGDKVYLLTQEHVQVLDAAALVAAQAQ